MQVPTKPLGTQESLAVSPTLAWKHQEGEDREDTSSETANRSLLEAAATEDKVPLLHDLPLSTRIEGVLLATSLGHFHLRLSTRMDPDSA